MYTKEEFHNNVLPRAAENQPPRILNELRQLSCRLVASGIAKGLLKAEDLPEIRKTLIARFEVRGARCACTRDTRGGAPPGFLPLLRDVSLVPDSSFAGKARLVLPVARCLPCLGGPRVCILLLLRL